MIGIHSKVYVKKIFLSDESRNQSKPLIFWVITPAQSACARASAPHAHLDGRAAREHALSRWLRHMLVYESRLRRCSTRTRNPTVARTGFSLTLPCATTRTTMRVRDTSSSSSNAMATGWL